MPAIDGIEALSDWFGTRSFKVSDISDDRVEELSALAGIQHPPKMSDNGRRTSIGRWLNRAADHDSIVHGRTARLVVLEHADGSKPGLYRIMTGKTS